jgi:sialic acid synthase SpsE
MKTRTIAELGSCHMGKWEYIKELIEGCAEIGFTAVKFQLFPNEPRFTDSGNVWLNKDLYLKAAELAKECGIDCSASVFSEQDFQFLKSTTPPWIKLAFSQKHNRSWIEECIDFAIEPIVSCDIMTDYLVPSKATKLYCIPEYPVRYEVSFDEIFPRFDGFSDHTLGYRQTLQAVREGATTIEKHVKLVKSDVKCPDAHFSVTLAESAQFFAQIKQAENVRDGA